MTVQSTSRIGDVRITLLQEILMPISVRALFPDSEAPLELLERTRAWLEPHFINERGDLLLSIHSFLLEIGDLRIVVDTCVGNDKPREGTFEGWHMRNGPYLQDLGAAGFPLESVDYVVCTHLHPDHVGWNTRLRGDAWVPTFERARYLLVDREWEYWSSLASARASIEDSVRPVVEASRVDLVPPDHRICPELWLEPAFGHTPGHVSVHIASGGAEAVITGDLLHSPIQCAAPDERPVLCRDDAEERATRRAFLERYADTEVVVFGTHFQAPAAGRILRDGSAYRYQALET